ncbi:Satratoxin biosynthesis SC1 cluster protein [Lachnellula subtilissima]|uniref:Satratoxin biosynthesis SC1 cluster protein n=1 Tax=Lachnellula subtilissima TaxID=602034 RepID=A0A8H8UEF5_9HELO|nr:Satratoxin biosynthesis SC1 cluster protein [Lachnellula subtilissima]
MRYDKTNTVISGVLISGVGRREAQLLQASQILLAFSFLYIIEECLIKISIICFYLRMFGESKSFRIQSYVLITVLGLWAVAGILDIALICKPFAYNWDESLEGGHCGNRQMSYKVEGGINVATDFLTMVLPIPQIIHLQLPMRRTWGLAFMFGLGSFITVVSILRIQALGMVKSEDFQYTLTMSLLWGTLEPILSIIATNLPMARTFLAMVAPSVFSSSLRKQTTGRSELTTFGHSRNRSAPNKSQFEVIEIDERFGYLKKAGIDVEMNRLGTQSRISGGTEKKKAGSKLSCI